MKITLREQLPNQNTSTDVSKQLLVPHSMPLTHYIFNCLSSYLNIIFSLELSSSVCTDVAKEFVLEKTAYLFLDSRCLSASFWALPDVTSSLRGTVGSGKQHQGLLPLSSQTAFNFLSRGHLHALTSILRQAVFTVTETQGITEG